MSHVGGLLVVRSIGSDAADLAIISIDGLDSATIRQAGLLNDIEYSSVNRHGAVGNFLGLYIDKNAEAIDHQNNFNVSQGGLWCRLEKVG